MPIDESLAKGLVKRQHRDLSSQLEQLRLSEKSKRGAAFRENVRVIRNAFKGSIIREMIAGTKKSTTASWFIMAPSDHGQFSVELVWASWKHPSPIANCILILSQHAVQRFMQKEADPLVELTDTVVGLVDLVLEHSSSDEREFSLTEFIGENELEMFTETGRLPMVWSEQGVLIAPTWISDDWSTSAKQKILKEERESGALFVGKRIKEMMKEQDEM